MVFDRPGTGIWVDRRHMCNIPRGMYKYKPCTGVNVRTASNHQLPVLGIDKLHLGCMQETPTGLIFREVFHVSRLRQNLPRLRSIEKAGSDFRWRIGRLTIANGKVGLVP